MSLWNWVKFQQRLLEPELVAEYVGVTVAVPTDETVPHHIWVRSVAPTPGALISVQPVVWVLDRPVTWIVELAIVQVKTIKSPTLCVVMDAVLELVAPFGEVWVPT